MKSRIATTCLQVWCAVTLLASCAYAQETTRVTPSLAVTPLPFSCDAFTENHWRELRFGVNSPEEYVEAVERVWGVEAWAIPIRSEVREDLWGAWDADSTVMPGLSYWVLFDRAEKLLQVAGYWDWQKFSRPTLTQVIDCLGPPEYYIAAIVEDRRDWLKFSLWYVVKGFVIQGSSFRPVSSGHLDWPLIGPGTSMGGSFAPQSGHFYVVAPGNLERMVAAVYGPFMQAWELCLVKPWPDSIEAVEIMSFEEYVECAT